MGDRSISRRNFLHRFAPPIGGARVEQVFPDQADLTAANFPESDFTLSGDLTPYAGPWNAELAAHLLRRTTFGVKKKPTRPVGGAWQRQCRC